MPDVDADIVRACREVAAVFAPGRAFAACSPLGTGHIHATLRVRFDDAGDELVLQQLNEHVFPDVDGVMANVLAVTGHLRARAGAGHTRSVLQPLRTPEGAPLVRDARGVAWRGYVFVAGTRAYDVVPSDALAERAARAFAEFVAALGDLDADSLAIPLPGFHDLPGRLAQLDEAVQRDGAGRLASATTELAGVREVGAAVAAALREAGADDLPLRVVHNDCKVNNLLFDAATDAPLCVVDLDTVMPGLLLADFGELVRTATCSAAEDERDLALVDFDAERFAALARGYVAGLGAFATPEELDALWLGGPWMAIENAARFLADHLDGDLYFPARRPEHNLVRTRAQLHLARELWRARATLEACVRNARAETG